MPAADMNRLMDHARIRLPGALDAAIKMELFAVMNESRTVNALIQDALQEEPTT